MASVTLARRSEMFMLPDMARHYLSIAARRQGRGGHSRRAVPGAVEIMGVALATSPVTVNGQAACRKGEYFRKELALNNASGPVWQGVTVSAPGQASVSGNIFVPKTPEQFTYDADGNLTSDGRWNYVWDGENRLVGMAARTSAGPQISLQFDYDWQGRRVRKQVWGNTTWSGSPTNDLRFVYDGWNLIAELDALAAAPALTLRRSYTWGLDLSGTFQGAGGVGGLLWVTDTSGQPSTHFAAYDGNGNVAALVNAQDSTISARYEYGPFGELLRATGPMAKANPFRFSTKYQDDETDLVYYGYRYYSASTGRWLSRDPLGEAGGRNLYGFVNNDGINRVDKDGRVVLVDDAVIIAAVGTIVVCAAAEAWVQSPAGQKAIHDIAAAATTVADAIAEGVKEAAKRCARCLRRNKRCLPCKPEVGSIAYRVDMDGDAHNGIPTPHSHMFVMLQSPVSAGCVCNWKEVLKDPVPGILTPPITPATGGGVAP